MEILELRADSDNHPIIICVFSKLRGEKVYYIQIVKHILTVSLSLNQINFCIRDVQWSNKSNNTL